jgi:hypothetical protein
MQKRLVRPTLRIATLLIALVFGLSLFVDITNAQNRRRRSRRTARPVVTNPTIAAPGQEASSDEAKIVRTADESEAQQADSTSSTANSKTTTRKTPTEQEKMQQTIDTLSNQVERLSDKLTEMQETDKTLLDMERLTRAEQRAENLRAQLIDAETKLGDLQARLEQVDYSLRPENIERATAGYGTLRPEDLRESRSRQLQGEKVRIQSQIRILETSKVRLEQSLLIADAEVDRLRQRLEARERLDDTTAEKETPVPESERVRPPE